MKVYSDMDTNESLTVTPVAQNGKLSWLSVRTSLGDGGCVVIHLSPEDTLKLAQQLLEASAAHIRGSK